MDGQSPRCLSWISILSVVRESLPNVVQEPGPLERYVHGGENQRRIGCVAVRYEPPELQFGLQIAQRPGDAYGQYQQNADDNLEIRPVHNVPTACR